MSDRVQLLTLAAAWHCVQTGLECDVDCVVKCDVGSSWLPESVTCRQGTQCDVNHVAVNQAASCLCIVSTVSQF
mgnify:CR=1 FL=1